MNTCVYNVWHVLEVYTVVSAIYTKSSVHLTQSSQPDHSQLYSANELSVEMEASKFDTLKRVDTYAVSSKTIKYVHLKNICTKTVHFPVKSQNVL